MVLRLKFENGAVSEYSMPGDCPMPRVVVLTEEPGVLFYVEYREDDFGVPVFAECSRERAMTVELLEHLAEVG
jgi:hypothetical protein